MNKKPSLLKLQLFQQGISQSEIATIAKVHRSFICGVVNGREKPSKKVRQAFCEVTGLSEHQLFGGESKKAS